MAKITGEKINSNHNNKYLNNRSKFYPDNNGFNIPLSNTTHISNNNRHHDMSKVQRWDHQPKVSI